MVIGGVVVEIGIWGGSTWLAELIVLLLLTNVGVHAPGMKSKREKLFQLRGWPCHQGKPLQPLLTLLKCGELAPVVKHSTRNTLLLPKKCYIQKINPDLNIELM